MSRANNIAFLFDNQVDRSTVTASTEEATLPDENLLDPLRHRVWRSTAGTSAYVDIVLAATETAPVSSAAVVDHNLTKDGTIQLQSWTNVGDVGNAGLANTDVTVSPWEELLALALAGVGDIEQAITDFGGVVRMVPITSESTDRYWRFTFTDAGVSYVQASRLFLSTAFQPAVNLSWNWSDEMTRRTRPIETEGGQRYGQNRAKRPVKDVSLDWLTYTDAMTLKLQTKALPDLRPIVVTIFTQTSLREHALSASYCTIEAGRQRQVQPDRFRQPLRLEEAL